MRCTLPICKILRLRKNMNIANFVSSDDNKNGFRDRRSFENFPTPRFIYCSSTGMRRLRPTRLLETPVSRPHSTLSAPQNGHTCNGGLDRNTVLLKQASCSTLLVHTLSVHNGLFVPAISTIQEGNTVWCTAQPISNVSSTPNLQLAYAEPTACVCRASGIVQGTAYTIRCVGKAASSLKMTSWSEVKPCPAWQKRANEGESETLRGPPGQRSRVNLVHVAKPPDASTPFAVSLRALTCLGGSGKPKHKRTRTPCRGLEKACVGGAAFHFFRAASVSGQ